MIATATQSKNGTLLYCKYMLFLARNVLGLVMPGELAPTIATIAPAVIPLGVSFFTFEFVHYLVDVYRGDIPVRNLRDFASFALFWPTMVAGPIKRYQQFVPALHDGIKSASAADAMHGVIRIAIGFAKKWAADNLTGWIAHIEPQLDLQPLVWRYVFLGALAFRILLDFSGYSDMAIGFARLMGIAVPENFELAVFRPVADRVQAALAHVAQSVDPRLRLYRSGKPPRQPRRMVNALAP